MKADKTCPMDLAGIEPASEINSQYHCLRRCAFTRQTVGAPPHFSENAENVLLFSTLTTYHSNLNGFRDGQNQAAIALFSAFIFFGLAITSPLGRYDTFLNPVETFTSPYAVSDGCVIPAPLCR